MKQVIKNYPAPRGKYGNFDLGGFADQLVHWIGNRRVLETFAGNGLLASMLAERNVDIQATTVFSSHDAHADGMYFDVTEMEASAAVLRYGDQSDILLMCWPTATEAAFKAAVRWGDSKPIVFIGEVTGRSLGFGGLGGCASDNFFDVTDEISLFSEYVPGNMLDRAAVRQLNPLKFAAWRDAARERILSGIDQMNELMPIALD